MNPWLCVCDRLKDAAAIASCELSADQRMSLCLEAERQQVWLVACGT